MAKLKPLIDAEGEMRELTAADFSKMKPVTALPRTEQEMLRKLGERGKQVAPTKRLVTLRLSASVLEHFKAAGPGWQTRIDETLRRAG